MKQTNCTHNTYLGLYILEGKTDTGIPQHTIVIGSEESQKEN